MQKNLWIFNTDDVHNNDKIIILFQRTTVAHKGVPSTTLSIVADSKLIMNGFFITKSLWDGVNMRLLLN